MIELNLEKFNFAKKIFSGLPAFLEKKCWIILAVALLAVVLTSGVIFYLYVLETPNPPENFQTIKIDKQLYQEVINRLDERQTNIQQGIEQNYPDVFR